MQLKLKEVYGIIKATLKGLITFSGFINRIITFVNTSQKFKNEISEIITLINLILILNKSENKSPNNIFCE